MMMLVEVGAVRDVWVLQVALILVAPPAIYACRHRREPPRAVRGAGMIVAGVYVVLFTLFIAGEALTDTGEWAGMALVAAWLVPMVLLSLLAWRRPDVARPALVVLVVAMAGLYAWSALAPDVWRAFEDATGPVRGIMTLALTAPLAVLAGRYVRDAGVLLLALAAMPVAVLGLLQVTDAGWVPWSLAALDLPLAVAGGLFLVAARLEARTPSSPPAPSPSPGTGDDSSAASPLLRCPTTSGR